MSKVYIANLVIYTGTDFDQTFNLQDLDANSAKNLTGYTGSAKLKRYEASLNYAETFTVSFPNPANGGVKIAMAATVTDALNPGKYSYDLLLKNPQGVYTRVVEGTALVKKSVTRD
jgi:hypothetical protein